MGKQFESLKNRLKSIDQEEGLVQEADTGIKSAGSPNSTGVVRYLLFGAFFVAFLLYAGARYGEFSNPVDTFFSWVDQPDERLLDQMGVWMEDMGYLTLSREDLIELRRQGVTATFTSRMRDLGYADLSLEDLVRLRQNDVSATFATMMGELGYELSIEDLIQLRQHGVTAHYTSNLHDLGYSDLSIEDLIRLRDSGVEIGEVEQLTEASDSRPTVEALIRYHISNQ